MNLCATVEALKDCFNLVQGGRAPTFDAVLETALVQ